MSVQPEFSVVIPAYNYGHCLARAVRSACGQEYSSFQVLVINDGSTDDTSEVVNMLRQESWCFEYLYQPNAGVSAARNQGVCEAAHDWLIFLDADDELIPGALSRFSDALARVPEASVIIAAHESVWPDGSARLVCPPILSTSSIDNLSMYLDKKLSVANGACALHRETFSRIQYRNDLSHTEDIPVFAHVLANYPAVSTRKPVARIHKHSSSRRHDAHAAVELGMRLEKIIFDESDLPVTAESLRTDYRFRRALSLHKLCYSAGDYENAISYFISAFRIRPMRSLAPRYLRRYLVSLWKR